MVLEAALLKPSMVLPGLDASLAENDRDEVARLTAQALMRTVPPARPMHSVHAAARPARALHARAHVHPHVHGPCTACAQVPPALPGIHFLSGGMGAEEATQNLQAIQRACPSSPWVLSFSYGRALQDPVLKAWDGDAANAPIAQQLLLDLARVNAEAQRGEWDEEHPSPGAGRVLLPKLSYSNERRQPAALFDW